MKYPKIKFDKYLISYRQVPYTDRYLVIKYSDSEIEISKIPWFLYEVKQNVLLPFDLHQQLYDEKNGKRWNKFINKMKEYNQYLDDLE